MIGHLHLHSSSVTICVWEAFLLAVAFYDDDLRLLNK